MAGHSGKQISHQLDWHCYLTIAKAVSLRIDLQFGRQVFVLPFALLLPALVPATFRRHLALPGKRPPFLHLALVGASFVVGIALIGVPAIEHGLILSVVRLPLEAVRLSLLKSHLGPDRVGGILVASALVAGLCSLVTLIVVNLFAPESNPAPLESPQIKLLATFAVLGTLNEVLLVGSVHLFRSLLSPLALVLPRNTILLWVSRLGHHGLPLRENWAQMMFVLPVGTAGWLLTDAEFAGAWRALGSCANWGLRRLRQRAGAPLPESEPASPGLARPVKSHKLARAAVSPLLALLALLPLVVYLLQSPAGASSLSTACLLLPDGVRASVCSQKALVLSLDAGTVDLVFSYYDEDMDGFKEHVNNIRRVPFVSEREVRVLVYNKGARTADEIRANLGLGEGDEVVGLPNLGREGATYLEHILRHYNDSVTVLAGAIGGLAPTRYGARTLAGHTFFLQPHLAWHWIAQPRIDSVGPDTGFAHFGPLMKNWCGRDDRGVGEYPLVKELYSVFVQDLCPPEGVLTAWSAQFVASRRRILAHPYQRYAKVAGLIEAPKGHWLHGVSEMHLFAGGSGAWTRVDRLVPWLLVARRGGPTTRAGRATRRLAIRSNGRGRSSLVAQTPKLQRRARMTSMTGQAVSASMSRSIPAVGHLKITDFRALPDDPCLAELALRSRPQPTRDARATTRAQRPSIKRSLILTTVTTCLHTFHFHPTYSVHSANSSSSQSITPACESSELKKTRSFRLRASRLSSM